ECTRGGTHKRYHYTGQRIRLPEPVTGKIGKGDDAREITYTHSSHVTKRKFMRPDIEAECMDMFSQLTVLNDEPSDVMIQPTNTECVTMFNQPTVSGEMTFASPDPEQSNRIEAMPVPHAWESAAIIIPSNSPDTGVHQTARPDDMAFVTPNQGL